MFTYALGLSIETINLRAVAEEKNIETKSHKLRESVDGKPIPEAIQTKTQMASSLLCLTCIILIHSVLFTVLEWQDIYRCCSL